MTRLLTPREVFHELVHAVRDQRWDDLPGLYALETDVIHPLDPLRAPALRTREQLRDHFKAGANTLAQTGLRFQPASSTVHDTADPEVIVAEFEYRRAGRHGRPGAPPQDGDECGAAVHGCASAPHSSPSGRCRDDCGPRQMPLMTHRGQQRRGWAGQPGPSPPN
jgi:uncharacterized protein